MNYRILIIDDEVEVCTLLKDFLKLEGYEVDFATRAREGIEKFKKYRPAIVLLDVRMPEMDGIEAMKEIRKIDKECGIILATAIVDQKVVDEAIRMGATDYIVKPFDLEYLRKSVLTKLADLID